MAQQSQPLNKMIDQMVAQAFYKIPKTSLIALQLRKQILLAYENLGKAIYHMKQGQDKKNYTKIQQLLGPITKAIDVPNYEKDIQFVNLTRNLQYQQLKKVILDDSQQSHNELSPEAIMYLSMFFKHFIQFNMKFNDVEDKYIQKTIGDLTIKSYNRYMKNLEQQKNKLTAEQYKQINSEDFNKMLKDLLKQTYIFKLVSLLQTGKSKDITEMADADDATRYIIPAIDEYKSNTRSEQQVLKDEIGQLLTLLQLNDIKVDEKEFENLDEKKVTEMLAVYNEAKKKNITESKKEYMLNDIEE